VYLDETPSGTWTEPLVGWLIEELVALDTYSYEYDADASPSPADRERHVVPATYNKEDGMHSAEEASNFWYLLGPDESPLSPADEAAERIRRAAEEARRQERQNKAAVTASGALS
jgi:hypothetical protein